MLLAACDPYFLPGALLAMLFQATVLGSPVATKERQIGGEMRVLTLRLQKESASGEETNKESTTFYPHRLKGKAGHSGTHL